MWSFVNEKWIYLSIDQYQFHHMNLSDDQEDAKSSNDYVKDPETWTVQSFSRGMEFVCMDAYRLVKRLTPNDLLHFSVDLFAKKTISLGSNEALKCRKWLDSYLIKIEQVILPWFSKTDFVEIILKFFIWGINNLLKHCLT